MASNMQPGDGTWQRKQAICDHTIRFEQASDLHSDSGPRHAFQLRKSKNTCFVRFVGCGDFAASARLLSSSLPALMDACDRLVHRLS